MICGPHVQTPPVPATVPAAIGPADSGSALARSLAPLLYAQPDEWFPLNPIVAVLHPTRATMAPGCRSPVPTDEEGIWVGYDVTHACTDIWGLLRGTILHADGEDAGQVAIDVQWGKHGSFARLRPRVISCGGKASPSLRVRLDRPSRHLARRSYAPRGPPLCFRHDYSRCRNFSTWLPLGHRLDTVVWSDNPVAALSAVVGRPYSRKQLWPS